MTNLYDLLREILEQVDGAGPKFKIEISEDDALFIKQYLKAPENLIHFKSRQIGEKDGEPLYSSDWALAGEPLNIFCLLSEAMLNNGFFADTVIQAAQFFLEHVPTCPDCQKSVMEARERLQSRNSDYTFKPHSK